MMRMKGKRYLGERLIEEKTEVHMLPKKSPRIGRGLFGRNG
jgi:hypothetical protein